MELVGESVGRIGDKPQFHERAVEGILQHPPFRHARGDVGAKKAIDVAVNRIFGDSIPPVFSSPIDQVGGESLLSELVLIEIPERPVPGGRSAGFRCKPRVDEPERRAVLQVRVESVVGEDGFSDVGRLQLRRSSSFG